MIACPCAFCEKRRHVSNFIAQACDFRSRDTLYDAGCRELEHVARHMRWWGARVSITIFRGQQNRARASKVVAHLLMADEFRKFVNSLHWTQRITIAVSPGWFFRFVVVFFQTRFQEKTEQINSQSGQTVLGSGCVVRRFCIGCYAKITGVASLFAAEQKKSLTGGKVKRLNARNPREGK